MTDLRKAEKRVFELLEIVQGDLRDATEILRQALAQPVKSYCGGKPNYCTEPEDWVKQELIDWEAVAADQAMTIAMMKIKKRERSEQREWVGLTDDEILDSADAFGSFQYGDAQGHKRLEFAKAIEAKLKEKNT